VPSNGLRNRRVSLGHIVCLSRLETGISSLTSLACISQWESHLCHEFLGLNCWASLEAFFPAASAARASQQRVSLQLHASYSNSIPEAVRGGKERDALEDAGHVSVGGESFRSGSLNFCPRSSTHGSHQLVELRGRATLQQIQCVEEAKVLSLLFL